MLYRRGLGSEVSREGNESDWTVMDGLCRSFECRYRVRVGEVDREAVRGNGEEALLL